jgi:hypothetical protein
VVSIAIILRLKHTGQQSSMNIAKCLLACLVVPGCELRVRCQRRHDQIDPSGDLSSHPDQPHPVEKEQSISRQADRQADRAKWAEWAELECVVVAIAI